MRLEKKLFHLFLLGGQHAVEILGNQRRQRLCHRDVHALFNRLG